MKSVLSLFALAAVAVATAQNVSSFQLVSFTGLTVTELTGNQFRVSLAPGATVTQNGVTSQIRDIFGFYVGATAGTMNATNQSGPSSWTFAGPGNNKPLAGWENNNKRQALTPGNSYVFDYGTLGFSSAANKFTGIHVRKVGDDTFYARTPFAPVPEPASMAVLGLGLAALKRRRRAAKA